MKGHIDKEKDIVIFLEEGDLKKFPKKQLEGILYVFNKWEKRFPLTLSFDETKGNVGSAGAYLEKKEGQHNIFVGNLILRTLLENNTIGVRYREGYDGSKMTFIDITNENVDKGIYPYINLFIGD